MTDTAAQPDWYEQRKAARQARDAKHDAICAALRNPGLTYENPAYTGLRRWPVTLDELPIYRSGEPRWRLLHFPFGEGHESADLGGFSSHDDAVARATEIGMEIWNEEDGHAWHQYLRRWERWYGQHWKDLVGWLEPWDPELEAEWLQLWPRLGKKLTLLRLQRVRQGKPGHYPPRDNVPGDWTPWWEENYPTYVAAPAHELA